MASPPPAELETRCAACGATSTGKFCSNCGAPFAGAVCGSCSAPLTPGAKFCHRCGTPAGASGPGDSKSFSSALPWAVAAIALVALIALVAGQRFAKSRAAIESAPVAEGPADAGGARPPDISNLSPADAAIRLYDRVMSLHERGRADSVALFAPMALAAYQMIGRLDLDQRYDMGRIAAVSGDEPVARAQADTILAQNPTHLLGLILAGNAARMRKDVAAERSFRDRLEGAAPAERAKQLPEYSTHENDIKFALDAKRP